METSITFKSKSKRKIDLLVQIAEEMGVKYTRERELTDEEMAIPGAKFTEAQFDAWLAKGDSKESYTPEEMLEYVKSSLEKKRKKKAA